MQERGFLGTDWRPEDLYLLCRLALLIGIAILVAMYERKRQLNVRLAIVLGLLTFGLFLPVIGFDFLNYDDPEYVVNNPPVNAGLSPKSVAWAFTTGYE